MRATVTRREFLQAGAFTLALVATPLGLRLVSAKEAEAFDPSVWVSIAPDDRVTVTVNKCEMGQGVYTAFPMILADELGADWGKVGILRVPAGPAYRDPVWGAEATGGSTSVRHMYEPLRRAGAAAREVLTRAAASRWGVPEGECRVENGAVEHPKSGRKLRFGQLAGDAAKLPVPRNPTLKKTGAATILGKPLARLDLPAKVQGKANFGIDSFVEGMLYGAIAHPPAFGAEAESYDEAAAKSVPGVRAVMKIGQGVGVCADTLHHAWKGRDALRVKWTRGDRPDLDDAAVQKVFHDALETQGVKARELGDVDAALRKAAKTVEAVYILPYLAHTTMEPMNCTADVRKERCVIWTPSQNQTGTLQLAKKITGLPEDRIRVNTTYLGCGLGRRFETDFLEEALQLSKEAARPVKLIWPREDDVRHDFYRPGNSCRIRGGLDDRGHVIAWAHRIAAPSIWARVNPGSVKDGVDPSAVEGVENTPYQIPNFRVEYVRVDLPVPVGFWRSVGNSENGFTMESFADELAHASGKDPLEFRLALLPPDSPSRRVLETVADKAGWARGPRKGQALGIAQHVSFGSAVAQVAEVSVDKGSGAVTIHRMVCAVDCGKVVNPDTVRAQLMGATIMGLSAGLKERLEFAEGGVASDNFDTYRLLRMDETPDVEVHIVEGGGPLGGIGEPGLPPTAPAVANAVFAAAGARLRRLPMTADAVKEAMKGS